MKFVKRIIFLVAIVLSAFNQTANSQSTGFGIEGGINLADMNISPNFTNSGRTAFVVGSFADIGVSKSFYVRPGLRYLSKGFTFQNNNGATQTERLSYLEFPLMLKVAFPLTEVKPYLMAGPTLGILLSASADVINGQQNQTVDHSQIYQTIDFGLYFGTGVDFHVAKKMDMFVGGGYSLGLTNVFNPVNVTVTGRSSGIQIMSGIKFNL